MKVLALETTSAPAWLVAVLVWAAGLWGLASLVGSDLLWVMGLAYMWAMVLAMQWELP
jgi:hypothetical protein